MGLSTKQKAHFEWQRDTFFRLSGEYISTYAKIENYMLQIVSFDRENGKMARHKLMKGELAGFYSNRAFTEFKSIMNSSYQAFLEKDKNKGLLKEIKNLMKFRNMLSHSHLSDNKDELEKLDKENFRIEYLRKLDKHNAPPEKFFAISIRLKDLNRKINELKHMAEFINLFRRHIKFGEPEPIISFRYNEKG